MELFVELVEDTQGRLGRGITAGKKEEGEKNTDINEEMNLWYTSEATSEHTGPQQFSGTTTR